MRSTFIQGLFLFSFLAFWQLGAQNIENVNFSYKNAYMTDVLNEWTDVLGIEFSYDADLMRNYRVSDHFNGLTTEEKLIKLLRKTRFDFDILSENSVVLKRRTIKEAKQYERSICGSILDKENEQLLAYVNISIPHSTHGAITDQSGHFQLSFPFVSDDSIRISYIGFKTKIIAIRDFFQEDCLDIYLTESDNKLQTVIVTASPSLNTHHPDYPYPRPSFPVNEIELVAGQVSSDIGHSIQLTEGVSSTDESATQWHIRGASPGQNQVLFDQIPLYHTGHFFGKISAINTNAVESVVVHKEGIDPQYGGRSAGVVAIHGKQQIPYVKHITLESDLLSANAMLSLPLWKRKVGIFLSYRRSFTDFFDNPTYQKLFSQTFQNSRITLDQEYIKDHDLDSLARTTPNIFFYDWTMKFILNLNANNRFSASFIHVEDRMNYDFDDGQQFYFEREKIATFNTGLNLHWQHKWSSKFHSNIDFSYSDYYNSFLYFDAMERDSALEVVDNFNKIKDLSFKLKHDVWGKNYSLTFGYQLNHIQTTASAFKQNPDIEDGLFYDDTLGITHALFANYSIQLKKFTFKLGSRFSYYNLIDKPYFEPRAKIRFALTEKITLRFNAGIYYQSSNQIVETNFLNVEDNLWVLSRKQADENGVFGLVKNQEYAFSIARQANKWYSFINIYKRHFNGITSKSLKFDSEGFPFYSGALDAQGLEVGIRTFGQTAKLHLAYTYSKAFYTFEYPEYPVSASYNRLHSLDVQPSYVYKNWHFSILFRLSSGRPYTPFKALGQDYSDPTDPSFWIQHEEYNKSRLPIYQRLDMSISKKIKVKKVNIRFSIGVQNILNHDNYLQRFYTIKYPADPLVVPKVVIENRLGLPFMPNIGLRLRF